MDTDSAKIKFFTKISERFIEDQETIRDFGGCAFGDKAESQADFEASGGFGGGDFSDFLHFPLSFGLDFTQGVKLYLYFTIKMAKK